MKRLFHGISKRRVIFNLALICVFSLFNSLFSTFMSDTLSLDSIPELRNAVLGLFCFLLVWLAEEFVLDLVISNNRVILENSLLLYYFNKIYDVKPEVLKKHNTGYISGLLRKCTTDQQETYEHFSNIGISVVYISYFAMLFFQYQFWVGVIVIAVGYGGSIMRILISNKLMTEVTINNVKAASDKDKSFIDITSNINTAQRLQATVFFNKLLGAANNRHYNTNIRWKLRDEVAFIFGKGLSFMFAPMSLLAVYLVQPELIHNTFFMGLIAMVAIQLPHNNRSLARFVSSYDKFKTALSQFDAIVNEESIRASICRDTFETLSITDMSFTYHKDKNETQYINIPNFTLNRGDFVVITGESGQGKTTLLNIMTGEIETDKVLINDTTKQQRLDCVFIAQDTEMFDLSIRENLLLGKNVPDEDLIWLLDEVGMGDWIRNTPDGLDTMLGERGIFVSTGQRQRLNLIRGLLCTNKEIYILDEPTSNVDVETEKRIVNLIKTILSDKTVVCVTHREPIIQLSNRRYIFENGTLQYHWDADCT